MTTYPVIPAKWFIVPTPGTRRIDWLVLHSAENPEHAESAERIGAYFRDDPDHRKASTHYGADSTGIVQYLPDDVIAYAAGGANLYGLHIEQAGRASQTEQEWRDDFGHPMLAHVAQWIADKATEYSVPIVYVNAAGLQAGLRGVTTHDQVSIAFRKDDHWDPGPDYPIGYVIRLATILAQTPEPQPEEDEMQSYIRYRDRRYQNIWLVGGGGAVHLSGLMDQHYAKQGVVLIEDEHDQALRSVMALSGTPSDALVGV